jgi:uncharacterized phosphosugar-binding protein
MFSSINALDQYFQAMRKLEVRAMESQRTIWIEVAERMAETARLLLVSGTEPPIFVSLNVMGAAEHNQALLEKWRPHNIHL